MTGFQGLTAEVGSLRSQLEAVTAERDQLSHSLYLQMEEVTGLVASQMEHHQLVAHFEA